MAIDYSDGLTVHLGTRRTLIFSIQTGNIHKIKMVVMLAASMASMNQRFDGILQRVQVSEACKTSCSMGLTSTSSPRSGVAQCWWRGSVVKASVFDWRTFLDVRLIYG